MVLLVIGIMVIAGVYIWERHRQKILDFINRQGDFDEFEFDQTSKSAPSIYNEDAEYDNMRVSKRKEPHFPADEFEKEELSLRKPESPPVEKHMAQRRIVLRCSLRKPESPPVEKQEAVETTTLGAPFLIQLSVKAKLNRMFSGVSLREAMLDLDLVYGEMGIFHRLDSEFREPLFSIASLVEPGTFPMDRMETFQCPGIVLFFQPAKVPNPLEVFDDLVSTGYDLAKRLDGIEWDETRRPLTPERVIQMRARLEAVYESQ
jgi:cell division protein ZipA